MTLIFTKNQRLWTAKDVLGLLKQSYWAAERSIETIQLSMDNSICYGVLHKDKLIGFGRVLTDYATVFWICDVIVVENYQGQGIGKKIMSMITEDSALQGLLGVLCTKDAHGLYEHYGFNLERSKAMIKRPHT